MTDTRREQELEAERRRKMAAIFGDALPDRTRDELGEGRADEVESEGAGDEEWLRRQVPPHHG